MFDYMCYVLYALSFELLFVTNSWYCVYGKWRNKLFDNMHWW